MKFSRTDRSALARWWQTLDRPLLVMILVLLGVGLLLSLAASPSIAIRRGFATYHFVTRQVVFDLAAVVIMIAVSFQPPDVIRRIAWVSLIGGLAGLVAVLFTGHEINGARRWLSIGGQTLQPSEFLKPGFIVVSAWLLAETKRRPDMPALLIAVALAAVVGGLLVLEPDVGQTLLLMSVWGGLYVISGQSWLGVLAIVAAGVSGIAGAYATYQHVRTRVDQFIAQLLTGAPGDHTQVDRSLQTFAEGGFFGRGPGEGQVKTVLPDAHTDFIFAVVAEEYGIIACLALVALFAVIAFRAVARAGREAENANRLAIFGLVMVFTLQAIINISVNIGLMPAKGMTLPFISAGGSSTLAVALTLGMLLGLTRRRSDLSNLKKPRLVGTNPAGGGTTEAGRAPAA